MKPMIAVATARLLGGTAQAVVPQFEDLSLLQARITAYLGMSADNGAQVQPLDQRLRLTRCPEPASIETMGGGELVVRCAAIGWRLRVPVIVPRAAQSAVVIRRSDSVELAVGGKGFSVLSTAVALEDGREGAMMRVKSPTGQATMTARVEGPGRVAIAD